MSSDPVSFGKAIADETRQKIMRLLSCRELCVGDLVAEMGDVTQPTVSHHLQILKAAGLVDTRRQGKQVYVPLLHVDRDLPGGLDGVRVKRSARLMGDRGKLRNRLHDSGFIVGGHHRADGRAGTDRLPQKTYSWIERARRVLEGFEP